MCRVKRRNTALALQHAVSLLPPLDDPTTPAGHAKLATTARGLLLCHPTNSLLVVTAYAIIILYSPVKLEDGTNL